MSLVILNFKAYSQAVGENALKLANISKEVADQAGVPIIVSPQTSDILRTSPIIETYSQHISNLEPGSGTGSTLAEAVKQAGASGSLLNHSEKRIPIEQIKSNISKLRTLGMKSVLCTQNPEESKDFAPFNPDYIAIEPPELIGSGVSVSTAKPEIVTETVKNIRNVNQEVGILCGAGISTGEDVKKAVELGVDGVLLASAFTKADNPKQVLEDICGGF
jgi:triosephosphate isomerase